MHILVTGATGFVGSRLVNALIRDGHRVNVLSRSRVRAEQVLPPAVSAFEWDSAREEPPAESLEGVEAVVNLMGESIAKQWTRSARARIRESRAGATAKLVRALPDSVRVFACASAIGYYPSDPERQYDETFLRTDRDDFLARVVLAWEEAAGHARTADRRVVALRFGVVLGPGGVLARLLPLFRLGLGGPIGNGRMWFSWVHVDDVVALILLSLSDPAMDGPLNLTAPHPVRFGEFATRLGSVLHRPAFLRAPEFAVRLALGEAAQMVLASQCVLPTRALALGYDFRFAQLDSALQDLIGRRR